LHGEAFHSMHKKQATSAVCILSLALGICLFGCASSNVASYTYDRSLLTVADAKFEKKRYSEALKIYQELAFSPDYAQSISAKQALYRIGYLNIYFDNPKADPKAALEAFNTFKLRYPNDKLSGDVTTWIKILVVLKSFEDQYDEMTFRVRRLQSKSAVTTGSLDTLIEAVQHCSVERDSLSSEKSSLLKKISELEQTIVKMEKSR
jgi:outer membrane protein assembly factor BamD (BamD/ComL family)